MKICLVLWTWVNLLKKKNLISLNWYVIVGIIHKVINGEQG